MDNLKVEFHMFSLPSYGTTATEYLSVKYSSVILLTVEAG